MKRPTGNKGRDCYKEVGRFSNAFFKVSHSTTHAEAGQKQDKYMHLHFFCHSVVDLYPYFNNVYLSMIDYVTVLNS